MKDYEQNWETRAVKRITGSKLVDLLECPACGEIALREIGLFTVEIGLRTEKVAEFECDDCGHYETMEIWA